MKNAFGHVLLIYKRAKLNYNFIIFKMAGDLRSITLQTVLWATERALPKVHHAFPVLTFAIKDIDDPLYRKYAKELPVAHIQKAMARVLKTGISWPKLVGIFALCTAMAQVYKDKEEVLLEIIGEFTTILHGWSRDWIEANGGWMSFISCVDKKDKNDLKYAAFNVLADVNLYLIYEK